MHVTPSHSYIILMFITFKFPKNIFHSVSDSFKTGLIVCCLLQSLVTKPQLYIHRKIELQVQDLYEIIVVLHFFYKIQILFACFFFLLLFFLRFKNLLRTQYELFSVRYNHSLLALASHTFSSLFQHATKSITNILLMKQTYFFSVLNTCRRCLRPRCTTRLAHRSSHLQFELHSNTLGNEKNVFNI